MAGHRYTQADRDLIIKAVADGQVRTGTFRKKSRIIAAQVGAADGSGSDWTVETDRGVMEAKSGDWLVTNHPDDDPGSDIWSISDERMRSTYEPA